MSFQFFLCEYSWGDADFKGFKAEDAARIKAAAQGEAWQQGLK
jgi:hypothetical protein